jgi:uncharacterized membrane protein
MRPWLAFLSEQAIVAIDAIALLVIVVGTAQVSVAITRGVFVPASNTLMRDAWLHYARWLVAGLTLQLAADIIETSISSSWEAIGRAGAIALIRTFLNFFLDRDVAEIRARQRDRATRVATPVEPPS